MPNSIYRFPLDPTGTNVNNLVVAEPHTLQNRAIRIVVPLYGAFFTDSLVIRDVTSGITLNTTQYSVGELYEFPTARYGKEICGVILIKDTAVSSNIEITYQALGGEYITNTGALVSLLETIDLDNRPVAWPDIIGKPSGYNPALHLHDIGDVYGFEYVVHQLERIRSAILIGDEYGHDEIRRYVDTRVNSLNSAIQTNTTNINNHLINTNNPHNTNKTHVGLGSVENFSIATQAEAEAGTVSNRYMTPLRVAQAITFRIGNTVNAHIARTDNPHSTTKAQVGLGSVENYGIATQAEAQAGTSNVKYATPLRVKEAIDQLVPTFVNNHANRTDNPHSTTKAQVGLGSVENFGLATQAEAQAGTINTKYMTPLTVAQAITSQITTSFNAHVARVDNPHSTTKAQVGLGSVENYGIATNAEALAGISNVKYTTPLRVQEAINQHNSSGAHDTRYVRKNFAEDTSLRINNSKLEAYVGGEWRIIWPAQWAA